MYTLCYDSSMNKTAVDLNNTQHRFALDAIVYDIAAVMKTRGYRSPLGTEVDAKDIADAIRDSRLPHSGSGFEVLMGRQLEPGKTLSSRQIGRLLGKIVNKTAPGPNYRIQRGVHGWRLERNTNETIRRDYHNMLAAEEAARIAPPPECLPVAFIEALIDAVDAFGFHEQGRKRLRMGALRTAILAGAPVALKFWQRLAALDDHPENEVPSSHKLGRMMGRMMKKNVEGEARIRCRPGVWWVDYGASRQSPKASRAPKTSDAANSDAHRERNCAA